MSRFRLYAGAVLAGGGVVVFLLIWRHQPGPSGVLSSGGDALAEAAADPAEPSYRRRSARLAAADVVGSSYPEGDTRRYPEPAPRPAPGRPGAPSRHPPPVSPGLSAESRRLWLDENATTHDIDRALALDVCSCSSTDCVRALQAPFYERRVKARNVDPPEAEAEAIRSRRNECILRLSRPEDQYREQP